MSKTPAIVLALIVVGILIGQAIAYYVPDRECGIRTTVVDDTIEYTIDSEAPFQCTELHLRNTLDVKRFYVFYDTDYQVASGDMSLQSAYYFLEKTFGMYSGIEVDTRNASEIRELIDSGAHDFGLIFISGVLPDTVYDGALSSPIVQWLQAGGYIVWSGDMFGRKISTTEDVVEVENYQSAICAPLFGSEGIFNDAEDPEFGNERVNPDLTGPAGIYFADTDYGADVSKITIPHLDVGYTDGTYTSLTVMNVSGGTLCHFGDYASAQESGYLAHAAVLGLTAYTEVSCYTENGVHGFGYTAKFQDSVDEKHLVILHDIGWGKVWIYDRSESRFL